ncbi:hypothetical protein DYB32_000748 [Aphanomyces invadans]|uniref:CG-1 domain-containing protein n=1 Tax=Aphanomyces invadans TaxID=157072 RepID=A0A418B8Z6_9STRA|nr:hypothetical protein DYB32_000748 [Aphanomyces invadans]
MLMSGGTLFVCDSVMDFKKDGWTWQKQKGSKTKIREDRAKLVVTRDNVVLGVYVHSADNPSFHRRSYSLRDESNRMILVHYLDDDSKKQAIPRDTQSPEEPFESSIVDDALADFHPGDPNEHGDGGDDDSAFDDLLLDHDMPDMEYNNHPNQTQSSSYKRARSENNYDGVSNMSFPSSPTNSLRGLDDRTIEMARALSTIHFDLCSGRTAADAAPLMLDDSAIAALSDVELGALSEQLIEDVVKQLVALAGTSSELLEEVCATTFPVAHDIFHS